MTTVQPCALVREPSPARVFDALLAERYAADWWRRRLHEQHNPPRAPDAVTHARRVALVEAVR